MGYRRGGSHWNFLIGAGPIFFVVATALIANQMGENMTFPAVIAAVALFPFSLLIVHMRTKQLPQSWPSPPRGLVKRLDRFAFMMGNIWWGISQLVIILAVLIRATVYESQVGQDGNEAAYVSFYNAWWFGLLFILFFVNIVQRDDAEIPLPALADRLAHDARRTARDSAGLHGDVLGKLFGPHHGVGGRDQRHGLFLRGSRPRRSHTEPGIRRAVSRRRRHAPGNRRRAAGDPDRHQGRRPRSPLSTHHRSLHRPGRLLRARHPAPAEARGPSGPSASGGDRTGAARARGTRGPSCCSRVRVAPPTRSADS